MANYAQSRYKTNFTPRKPVKTFRDLDIYQKTMECAVIVVKNIRPKLKESDRTRFMPQFLNTRAGI